MITPTKVEPTTSDAHIAGTASGVWSAQDQLEARRGGAWPDASVADPDTLIENNFSIDLWSGDGDAATTTITNNINLSGKGGLVWIKKRSAADGHMLIDTVRGAGVGLESHSDSVESDISAKSFQFNTNGFQFDTADGQFNASSSTYVGWTFKKAPKFFSIFKFTHSNGTDTVKDFADDGITTLGMVAVKKLDQANQNWNVWHRSLSASNKKLRFNTTGAETGLTEFSISGTTVTFVSGEASADYVMYVWQHETGSDSMIQCSSFTANASGEMSVDLGFEPQFVMIKNRQSADDWLVFDTMRGYTTSQDGIRIKWNTNDAEAALAEGGHPNATGFATDGDGPLNAHTYIYMAIRRPNMATITDATKVFAVDDRNGSTPEFTSGFPVDFALIKDTDNASSDWEVNTRLLGATKLITNDTDAEASDSDAKFDLMNGHKGGGDAGEYSWMWKRAKGYFDAVAYTGTGSARTIAHGLTVQPEMIWVKRRNGTTAWAVYYGDNTDYLVLNTDAATVDDATYWNDTSPTTSVFTLGTSSVVNGNGDTWVAYLFATLAGVSKVGSYTGTGDASAQTIDCGFTSGARFVLIKCTSHSGQWHLFDSARGITSTKNDGVLYLNGQGASQAESSAFGSAIDAIQPDSSGFKVQYSDINTDGRSFLFYAIA